MDFGISHAKIDEIGFITHAENLGYTHCWVTDSQSLRSDAFAVLALAAQQTRTIKLGVGVAVAGLRLAPVTACSIATINRLASKTLLLVDTCKSGAVTGKRRGVSDFTEALRDLLHAETGTIGMAASTGQELSQERPEWGHGAFTKALLEGLAGKADVNGDGIVDIKEMDLYVTNRVKDLTQGGPHPTTEIPRIMTNIPIATWR
ncbi:MAG: LLM class flavin-dependent oxidoreductase [Candidatus Lambdaproteobacteria bacterium]|nr:LLM class flavin-dependent oxidoreductase [Candidatus Lambdaproteobacteria bacterium]